MTRKKISLVVELLFLFCFITCFESLKYAAYVPLYFYNKKKKLDPFWTRIRYWIRSIHGSKYGSCKTGPADPGPDLDPVLENGSGSGSRSDPLSSLLTAHIISSLCAVICFQEPIAMLPRFKSYKILKTQQKPDKITCK